MVIKLGQAGYKATKSRL